MIKRLGLMTLFALLLSGCIPNQEYQQPEPLVPPPAAVDRPRDRGRDQDRPYLPPPNFAQLQAPWEMRPVVADAQDVPDSDYVVSPGEGLRGIANKTGAGSEAIARANGLVAPFVIYPGQRLHIPGGRYHLVRAGETGIAIARAYNVPWSRIIEANDLVEPYVLRAGQRVLIPTTEQSAAERKKSFELMVDDIVTGGEPALALGGKPVKAVPAPTQLPNPADSYAEPPRLTGAFLWPVNGPVVRRFGPGPSGERNDGIKIAVPLDTPIKASQDGVVAYTGEGVAGLGGLVIVKHGNGWTTVYGHAHQVLVQRGQSVKRGQTIALSGDTGFADRPEVHFEMRKGRTPVDPLANLPSR
jgi:murein DD-endopeptidase MepM/ murein hydrolase activator NlpD